MWLRVERAPSPPDTFRDRGGLVQARDHDRDERSRVDVVVTRLGRCLVLDRAHARPGFVIGLIRLKTPARYKGRAVALRC